MLLNGYRRVHDVRMGRKSPKLPRAKRFSTNSEPAYITRLAQDPIPSASPVRLTTSRSPVDSIGLTPFRHICPMCHRSFHWLCSLKRHILTHMDESDMKNERPTSGSFPSFPKKYEPLRPYVCEKCDADFETNSLLIRHINSVHGYPIAVNNFNIPFDRAVQVAKVKIKRSPKTCPEEVSTESISTYIESSSESSMRSGYSDDDGLGVEKKLDRISAQQYLLKQQSLHEKKIRSPTGKRKPRVNSGGKTASQLSKRLPHTVKDRIFM